AARLAVCAALLAVATAGAEPRGRVTGVVRLAGPPPPARPPVDATVDPAVCGATIADESLVVDANGGVRDAVVVLRGRPRAPPMDLRPAAVIDNLHCHFTPRVQVLRRGQTVRARNSDPVLHNTHATLVAAPEVPVANLALALQGQSMDLTRRLAEKLPEGAEAL